MTRILLVRHGQTQAEGTAERIAQRWEPAALFSSPLSRAMQTAQAIGRRCRLPVQPHPGLIDIDYGRCQGLTPEEVSQQFPSRARLWYRGARRARPPRGESLGAIIRRCLRAVRQISSRHPGQTVVVVGRDFTLGLLNDTSHLMT